VRVINKQWVKQNNKCVLLESFVPSVGICVVTQDELAVLRVFCYSQFRCVTHLYLHKGFVYKLSIVIYSIHVVTVDICCLRTHKIVLLFVKSCIIESGISGLIILALCSSEHQHMIMFE
jgi:hypothetical protein